MASIDDSSRNVAWVDARNSQGSEIHAKSLRLMRHHVVFELYSPAVVLQISEVLTEFKIVLRDQTAYVGRAVVRSLVNTGTTLVCEATLDEGWLDLQLPFSDQPGLRLRTEFQEFAQRWNQFYRIRADYKIVVADMQSFLMDLRQWLEQVEVGIRSSPSADQAQLEREILSELGQAIVPVIDGLFEKFEAAAEPLEEGLLPAHQAYMRQQLHPLVLCSPFAYRTFQKPLGYAGDYEMVNMMARDPYEGSTVFAKIVNLWFLMQPPAEAHRNRLAYLEQKLFEEAARLASVGRRVRILDLGCGPAVEVQRFVARHEASNRAHFTLLDFNEETLVHVRSVVEQVKRTHQRHTEVQTVKKPVIQLLKEVGRTIDRPAESQYDFVYCAGLYDYLTAPVCQRLSTLMYDWVAPGGLLLATNVAPWNPLRNGMEHLLDWHLVYRNSAQMRELKPAQVSGDDVTVRSDVTGVNLILEVRKGTHGR